jgi:hypothetical protein
MLHFSARPHFSFEVFLGKCAGLIPEKDREVLKSLPSGDFSRQKNEVLERFSGFETLLKNELVKLRAARKKVPAEKYLRSAQGYAGEAIYHRAVAAQRNPSPLEGERILDQTRWEFLDTLSLGHYFDADFLIIYALKLLILERWEKINQADKAAIIREYA